MKAQPGDRVRVRHRYAAFEGEGTWGTVQERQGKRRFLVVFDGWKRRRSEYDANVVEVVRAMGSRGDSEGEKR